MKAGDFQIANLTLPLRVTETEQILPHRFPFLMVDQVLEFTAGEKIVGVKAVTANEFFFAGHFPRRPLMPGVLILESLAQLGAIYAKLTYWERVKDRLIVFCGADNVRFRRQVLPGDLLRLELCNCVRKLNLFRMEAVASVDGEVACEAVVLASEIR